MGAVNHRGQWQGMERGVSTFQEDDVMSGGQSSAAGGHRLSWKPDDSVLPLASE